MTLTPATYTRHGLTENDALNLLQDAGIISDLCLSIADIADADGQKVVEFFEGYGL